MMPTHKEKPMNTLRSILNTAILTGLLGVIAFEAHAQSNSMQLFSLDEVQLLKSPFLNAENTDLKYMLKLDPNRLLSPFLREAGLKPKAESYGNWENSGLDGHTAGHYLTALAQMYASTNNAECKRRLDYMVSEFAKCQDKNENGYVGGVPGGNAMWLQVKRGDFSEFFKKWVPWYNLHKLFAGLRDSYLLAGNQQAKIVFIKLMDWADDELRGLDEKQIQGMLNMEQGGMDEVCADAYALTGKAKYLDLAKKFCHQAILKPLEEHVDKLDGLHANTQIPKVIGFERIGDLSHDSTYLSAARFFWQTVVRNRSISIGGNSVREHFNPSDDFTTMLESEQGPETCNSNNMLKLTKMLFRDDARREYIDFYERLLYNHILSSQNPDSGGFVYFTPIHPQHYRVYSTASESFWCCVGTGMENHGKYGELIYTHANNDIYVNLFIPSILNWKEGGIKLIQQNNFPESAFSGLTIETKKPKKITIYIRKPDWVKENGFVIHVNGNKINLKVTPNGYAEISRLWRKGDKISVLLPMKNYVEYLPDHSDWVSFRRGPIVLSAPTDTDDMPGLFANGSRWGHIAGGQLLPLADAPMLVKTNNDPANALKQTGKAFEFEINGLIDQDKFKKLKLIPFYKVHDTRYMLYWPITTLDSLKQFRAQLSGMDETYLKLASRTVDEVTPGEQQPENDHQLQFENAQTGIFRNMHWRAARGGVQL